MFVLGSIPGKVIEVSIAHFDDGLLDNILACSAIVSIKLNEKVRVIYAMPNLSSFILLGTLSTTCSFTDSVVAIVLGSLPVRV